MYNIKLTAEQGDLAFHILAVMQERFPDNPELTIPALQAVSYTHLTLPTSDLV